MVDLKDPGGCYLRDTSLVRAFDIRGSYSTMWLAPLYEARKSSGTSLVPHLNEYEPRILVRASYTRCCRYTTRSTQVRGGLGVTPMTLSEFLKRLRARLMNPRSGTSRIMSPTHPTLRSDSDSGIHEPAWSRVRRTAAATAAEYVVS